MSWQDDIMLPSNEEQDAFIENVYDGRAKDRDEVEILEATKEYATEYGIHYDSNTESMILNAMREMKKRTKQESITLSSH